MSYANQFADFDSTLILRELQTFMQGDIYHQFYQEPCFCRLIPPADDDIQCEYYAAEIDSLHDILDHIQDHIMGFALLRGTEIAIQAPDPTALNHVTDYSPVLELPEVQALIGDYDRTLTQILASLPSDTVQDSFRGLADRIKKLRMDAWPHIFAFYLAAAYKMTVKQISVYYKKSENATFSQQLYNLLL